MSSKSLTQIFRILFQAEYINICVLCGAFFSQLKSSFCNEKKTSAVKSEAHFSRKAVNN